ncbi:putative Polyprotein [Cinnamomum micranthum f. kanehirae]|uniref:Putative Polyprotein n=1 Tax=Cinnamomum micranthum f. kanehirae TaxID=337451 RepID=A0A3S3QRT2_9MAGN|nr:putative Polyprotein [Cinnamomum micranthum f. kanehirae]
MAESTPVQDHMLKMMDLLNELDVLAATIDSESQIDIILESLPDSFNNFKFTRSTGQGARSTGDTGFGPSWMTCCTAGMTAPAVHAVDRPGARSTGDTGSGAGGYPLEEECQEEAVGPTLAREWQPDDVM